MSRATSLLWLLASGSILIQAQEAPTLLTPQAERQVGTDDPDGSHRSLYEIQYKRFTRGDHEKVVDEAKGKLEWFRERMGGDLSPEFMLHTAQEAARQRRRFSGQFQTLGGPERLSALNPAGNWTCLGPTGSTFTQNGTTLTKVDSGRPNTILPDTADATGNTVYVLAAGGGLWKTTNFLSATPTWTAMTDTIGTTAGGAVAFGRSTSTLYLGTGDAYDYNVGGFFVKSSNGGQTWGSAVALGASTRTLDLKVDSSQAQDIILVGTDAGLWRSADAGATFTQIAGGTGAAFEGKQIWSLARTSAGWLAAAQATTGGAGSMYLSTDQGLTWNAVGASTVGTGTGHMTLGVGQPGDAIVYAFAGTTPNATSGATDQKDLYRSTNGGSSWTALNINGKVPSNSNSDQTNMDLMHNQAFYNQMILVDPTDVNRNTIYLGGNLSSAKSTDGGSTWRLTSNWLAQFSLPYIHADFHCAAFSNFGGVKRVYVGTDGGIFTSTDGGTTWDDTKNKGMVNHLIYALTTNPASPNSVLVGLQDNGTRLRDGSTSIFNQPKGGDGFGVGWSQAGSTAALCSYVFSQMSVSTSNPPDDQSKWTSFTSGIVESTGNNGSNTDNYFVTAIVNAPPAADPSGNTFFHYTRTRLYRTTNAGSSSRTWNVIGTAGSNGLPTGNITRAQNHGISCSPTDRNRIAVAGSSSRVFLTTDGGSTWTTTTVTATIPGWLGYNSNVAWASNSTLYLCSESMSTAAGTPRVARSLDGGATWSVAGSDANGLPNLPITKLVVDGGDGTGNTVYAATWLGVYRTTDGGSTWSLFGAGLPQVRVSDIYLAPDSSYLRVSTWGRGVWEVQNSTTPVVAVSVSPTTASLNVGGTQTFTATVTGTTNTAVTWSVQEAGGGTVSASGLYTAPSTAGTYHVKVTSQADTTKSATATITVNPNPVVTVAVNPTTATVNAGGTQTFTATVTGSSNTAVTWSVQEAGGGSVSASGLYTAPSTAGTYHVIATSQADSTKSATATVTVNPAPVITVAVSPTTASLTTGGTQTFTATVTGSSNTAVTWSVQEAGGGTVTTSGLYTAPATAGTYHVKATSQADTSKSATATITVSGGPITSMVETETNDTIATANGVSSSITSIQGNLTVASDVDYYAVTLAAGEKITVAMSGPSGPDWDLYLVNASGGALAQSTGGTTSESLTYTNSGSTSLTVYIKVIVYSGTSSTPYTLGLTRVTPPPSVTFNEVEANDSQATANVVADNVTKIVGYIGSSTDNDYFKLNVAPGRTLAVAMTGPTGSTYDYDLYFYDASGVQLAASEGSTTTENASWTNSGSTTATVTVAVKRYAGSSTTTPYNLAITR